MKRQNNSKMHQIWYSFQIDGEVQKSNPLNKLDNKKYSTTEVHLSSYKHQIMDQQHNNYGDNTSDGCTAAAIAKPIASSSTQ